MFATCCPKIFTCCRKLSSWPKRVGNNRCRPQSPTACAQPGRFSRIWTFLTSPDAHRIVQLPSSELQQLHTPHRVAVHLRPQRTHSLKTATIRGGWSLGCGTASYTTKPHTPINDHTFSLVSCFPTTITREKRIAISMCLKKRQAEGKIHAYGRSKLLNSRIDELVAAPQKAANDAT